MVVYASSNDNGAILYYDNRSDKTVLVSRTLPDDAKSTSAQGDRLDFVAPGWLVQIELPSDIKGNHDTISNKYPHNEVAEDSNGNLGMVLYEADTASVLYGYKSNGTWVLKRSETGTFGGFYPSIDFDSSDNPHISFTTGMIGNWSTTQKAVRGIKLFWLQQTIRDTSLHSRLAQMTNLGSPSSIELICF